MYPAGGFSIEDMQEFFLDNSRHNKRMKTDVSGLPLGGYYSKHTRDRAQHNGLFMQAHNTVVSIQHGALHNDQGPAKVMFTKEGKPYYSIFARKGNIIPYDEFEVKLRQLKVKRIEKSMNQKKEKEKKMKERLQVDEEIVKQAVLDDLQEFIMQKALARIKDPDDAMEVAERIHEELTEEAVGLGFKILGDN